MHGSNIPQTAAFDTSSLFSPHDETDPLAVTPPDTVSQQSRELPQTPSAMALSPARAGLRGLTLEAVQPTVTGLDVASFMPPHLTPRQVNKLLRVPVVMNVMSSMTLSLTLSSQGSTRTASQNPMAVFAEALPHLNGWCQPPQWRLIIMPYICVCQL